MIMSNKTNGIYQDTLAKMDTTLEMNDFVKVEATAADNPNNISYRNSDDSNHLKNLSEEAGEANVLNETDTEAPVIRFYDDNGNLHCSKIKYVIPHKNPYTVISSVMIVTEDNYYLRQRSMETSLFDITSAMEWIEEFCTPADYIKVFGSTNDEDEGDISPFAQIKGGTLYDCQHAEKIARIHNDMWFYDIRYHSETLYRKKDGKLFLFCEYYPEAYEEDLYGYTVVPFTIAPLDDDEELEFWLDFMESFDESFCEISEENAEFLKSLKIDLQKRHVQA